MNTQPDRWLLLIVSLPTSSSTARIRIWRALKNLGCGALRDGVYLLPHSAEHQQHLSDLSDETQREGGSAWLLTVLEQSDDERAAFRFLFDRSSEHEQMRHAYADVRKTLSGLKPQEITRLLRKLRRDYDALLAIDYFPNEASAQTEAAWMDFVNVAELMLSPGEPQAIACSIGTLDVAIYQNRIWATRRHLWVDRVASAWLIQRFIDPGAGFLWLDSPADCPSDALGFDFDGASFTHIGDRVTFEVLLASFDLEQDPGLMRLGAMVHALDMGNGFVPEAIGFEAILTGARQRAADDDRLLAEIGNVLDSLLAHFSRDTHIAKDKK